MRLLLAISFLFICTKNTAQSFDVSLLQSIYNNQSSFKDNFSKTIAGSVTVVNIAAPVSIFAAGLIKHNKQLQKDAAYIAGAFVISSIATYTIKHIVKRARPYVQYPNLFSDRLGEGGDYSFPSGHTSAAFCTATSLSLYFPKWYVIAPSYLWAATVGWARMYQGVHYPADVLAGAIIGSGSAWLGYVIQKRIDKKHVNKRLSF